MIDALLLYFCLGLGVVCIERALHNLRRNQRRVQNTPVIQRRKRPVHKAQRGLDVEITGPLNVDALPDDLKQAFEKHGSVSKQNRKLARWRLYLHNWERN